MGETNFIADIGYEQDANVVYLLDLALRREITLVIPEICFYEIYTPIYTKINRRLKLSEEIRKESNQLKRSRFYKDIADEMKTIAEKLDDTYKKDLEKFDYSLNKIKDICTQISYTERGHKNAYLLTLDKRYGLINPDASIYESIKEFARKNKGIKIHLNKNTDDFDKPIIHKELKGLGHCR